MIYQPQIYKKNDTWQVFSTIKIKLYVVTAIWAQDYRSDVTPLHHRGNTRFAPR